QAFFTLAEHQGFGLMDGGEDQKLQKPGIAVAVAGGSTAVGPMLLATLPCSGAG
ncbi:unnamed protein product, partial [Pylaiella littoralis]